MFKPFRFQPGWATPIVTRHEPSFFATFLKFGDQRGRCRMRKQGKCPGLDQCHDCNWSSQSQRD